MSSIIIATAGHVHHGKSSFLTALTGQPTNKRPDEQRRGLTLDLGFVHTPQISFIDCPGHRRLVKHLIAGHHHLHGVCLIISLKEGLQEQTYEHLRIINWLNIPAVFIVFTKSDLIEQALVPEKCLELFSQVKSFLNPQIKLAHMIFSKFDIPSNALSMLYDFFNSTENPAPDPKKRFFIDRAFSIPGQGTIVTGTHLGFSISIGQQGLLFEPCIKNQKKFRVRSLKNQSENFNEWTGFSRLAIGLDGVETKEIRRGSILLFEKTNLNNDFVVQLSEPLPKRKSFYVMAQFLTLSLQCQLIPHQQNLWRMKLPFPAPLFMDDLFILRHTHRVENFGQCFSSGKILNAHKKTKPTLHTQTKVIPQTTEPLNFNLLQEIHSLKWQARTEKINEAHALCKSGLAHLIKENLFISQKRHEELKIWLSDHFKNKKELTIEHARDFLKTNRKDLISILEYCDRHHWTFRKENSRYPFRLVP